MSMSVDGNVTGPHPSPEHPLGVGGEVLHSWFSHADRADLDRTDVLAEAFARAAP